MDVPAGATQEEGHTRISHPPSFCGTRLNFFREKDSAVFSFSFSSFFLFLFVSKNPSSCDCTGIRTLVFLLPNKSSTGMNTKNQIGNQLRLVVVNYFLRSPRWFSW